jgi:FtsP/CotA-like multicopper oxidase with cupredoxin domain
MRMPAMDVRDVRYDAFLMNGKKEFDLSSLKAGDVVKLRIINASSSSSFWIQFAGGKMKVVSADGQDVKPVDVDKFLIATAETYDVIIKIPSSGKYELRATAQDISGHTSAFFGEGNEAEAPAIPKVDYFKIMHHMNTMMSSMNMKMGVSKGPMTNIEVHHEGMGNLQMNNMKMNSDTSKPKDVKMDNEEMGNMHKHDMNMMQDTSKPHDMKMGKIEMGNMQMGGMNMSDMKMCGFDYPPGNGSDKVLSYKMLKATNNDSAIPKPEGEADRLIELTATGNMFRYVWSFNNKTLTDADKILIKKGEHVRVIFHNNTMMEHPLHLHGHFFRLLNGSTLD